MLYNSRRLSKPANIHRTILIVFTICLFTIPLSAQSSSSTGLGIDVDFYTGPISSAVWNQIKEAGHQFVIAQAWGGRSRNEFASSQLRGARSIAGLKTAAYILLNYDDKVCRTFSHPVRDNRGRCAGNPVTQSRPGSRWQVQQGLAALGSELAHVAFVAIDVEWFISAAPSTNAAAQARRRKYILDAVDELRRHGKDAVIYTRNIDRHWSDITGCSLTSKEPGCRTLYKVMNDSTKPVPLWDVQTGTPELGNFQPHGEWTIRAGRQYQLDASLFGLPPSRTVDLNVFDLSLFGK